jgi:hypothetical protein
MRGRKRKNAGGEGAAALHTQLYDGLSSKSAIAILVGEWMTDFKRNNVDALLALANLVLLVHAFGVDSFGAMTVFCPVVFFFPASQKGEWHENCSDTRAVLGRTDRGDVEAARRRRLSQRTFWICNGCARRRLTWRRIDVEIGRNVAESHQGCQCDAPAPDGALLAPHDVARDGCASRRANRPTHRVAHGDSVVGASTVPNDGDDGGTEHVDRAGDGGGAGRERARRRTSPVGRLEASLGRRRRHSRRGTL